MNEDVATKIANQIAGIAGPTVDTLVSQCRMLGTVQTIVGAFMVGVALIVFFALLHKSKKDQINWDIEEVCMYAGIPCVLSFIIGSVLFGFGIGKLIAPHISTLNMIMGGGG